MDRSHFCGKHSADFAVIAIVDLLYLFCFELNVVFISMFTSSDRRNVVIISVYTNCFDSNCADRFVFTAIK